MSLVTLLKYKEHKTNIFPYLTSFMTITKNLKYCTSKQIIKYKSVSKILTKKGRKQKYPFNQICLQYTASKLKLCKNTGNSNNESNTYSHTGKCE